MTTEQRAKLQDDLEGPLCAAVRMAGLAEQAAGEDEGMSVFTTLHLVDMVRALQEIWKGQPAGPILGR